MDRDLSLPFGQLALKTMLRSARRADRPADVALAAGMAGLVGVQSFCALGCSCAERALVCARVEANLSRIGLRAERAESLAALRRGRGAPVVWLNDGTPPVALIGRSAGVWEDANSRQDDAGVTGPALEDAPPNGTLWTVTTCERPEPGDVALTRAVLELVSDWLRPPVVGACRRAGRTRLGLGLSAYEMWLLALADCKRLSSQRRDAIRVGFERWTVGVSATAAFISHVAGRRRNAWAQTLRDARGVLVHEADGVLAHLIELPSRGALGFVRDGLFEAQTLAAEAAGMAADAALHMAGVSGALASELACMAPDPPDRRSVSDLVYLARAGSAPLRVLSLRRLAYSHDAQARATLREVGHDADAGVAGVARWGADQ